MNLKLRDKYICIEEVVIITLFLCFLSESARVFLSNYFICYLYITFHELAHIFIASIFGYEIRRLNIKLAGMNAVFKEEFSGIKGIVIYLAGPISNIILAMVFRNIKIVYDYPDSIDFSVKKDQEIGSVKNIKLCFHAVIVVRPFEHRHKWVIPHRRGALSC